MTTHNRTAKTLVAVILICILCLLFVPTGAFAEEISDPPIILLDKGKVKDNRVEIEATLARNSGILSMLLSLNYDGEALKLVEVKDGTALSSLSKQHSGTLSTMPYKIHYMWEDFENDYSTGVLLTLVFEIKDGAKNGAYSISLKAANGQQDGVEYLDGGVRKTKKLMSDSVTITVDGSKTQVEVVSGGGTEDPTEKQFVIMAIVVSVAVVGIIFAVFVAVLKLRKGSRSKKQ